VGTKGRLSNKTALAMIYKLADTVEKSWRRLDGHNLLPKLVDGHCLTQRRIGVPLGLNDGL
jgi:putative transposase